MKTLIALLFSFVAFAANAQTVTDVVTQSCNIALTQCVIIDADDNDYAIVGAPYNHQVYVNPATVNGVSCAVTLTLTVQTTRHISYDMEYACADGTVIDGVFYKTYSGSGRGQHWVSHVQFYSVATP